MKTERVDNPVFGQVYMASRYYNSKRIVWEPFRFEGPGSQTHPFYQYKGTWLLDNRSGNVGSFRPFDPKWVDRKIKDLNEEASRLAAQVINLRHLQTSGV